jgi:hypothetical protein
MFGQMWVVLLPDVPDDVVDDPVVVVVVVAAKEANP